MTDSRKPTMMFVEDPKPSKFNVGLMCGDCLHYKGSPHPKFEAACVKRGVGQKSDAPNCFTPDVSSFRNLSKDVFPAILALLSLMSHKQSRVLMGLLKYAGSLEKVNLTFLEVVYFCKSSVAESYLEDYLKGYALSMTRTGQVVIVGSDYLRLSPASMVAYLDKSSVLKEKAFEVRKAKLLAAGKVHRLKTIKGHAVDSDYEVPTIDHEPGSQPSKSKRGSKNAAASKQPYDKGDYTMST